MAQENDKRKVLLNFLDKNAFDVIIHTSTEKYKEKDKATFEEVRQKTVDEKKKFHQDYVSAKAVKENFLQNVQSVPAQKLNKKLEHLGLPTMPALKDDFKKLCQDLSV